MSGRSGPGRRNPPRYQAGLAKYLKRDPCGALSLQAISHFTSTARSARTPQGHGLPARPHAAVRFLPNASAFLPASGVAHAGSAERTPRVFRSSACCAGRQSVPRRRATLAAPGAGTYRVEERVLTASAPPTPAGSAPAGPSTDPPAVARTLRMGLRGGAILRNGRTSDGCRIGLRGVLGAGRSWPAPASILPVTGAAGCLPDTAL